MKIKRKFFEDVNVILAKNLEQEGLAPTYNEDYMEYYKGASIGFDQDLPFLDVDYNDYFKTALTMKRIWK